MPIGIQRLNARHQQPTPHIIFIKPLPGPTEKVAQSFLERIAAISHPIMKNAHLSVMTLEEYEPNREFIGRNFNAGEVIQLVLRTHSGAWLPFRSVAMVMMHELAHCRQMNHSRAFWKVRNEFAAEMRALWLRGYTGEGVWGKGRNLGSGAFEGGREALPGELPEHLCGGSYRSRWGRGRKRKRSATSGGGDGGLRLSYAERQQRRIAKKFGKAGVGVALGDDEEARVKLEQGKGNKAKGKGKPRVAGSLRGRELRAQAALARFGQQSVGSAAVKVEPPQQQQSQSQLPSFFVKKEEQQDQKTAPSIKMEEQQQQTLRQGTTTSATSATNHNSSASESDDDDDDYEDEEPPPGPSSNSTPAKDMQGNPLRDSSGRIFIKVCADADTDADAGAGQGDGEEAAGFVKDEMNELVSELYRIPLHKDEDEQTATKSSSSPPPPVEKDHHPAMQPPQCCPICSLSLSLPSSQALFPQTTCPACAHVLCPAKMPGSWRCESAQCVSSAREEEEGNRYVNSADCAYCGVCGAARRGKGRGGAGGEG